MKRSRFWLIFTLLFVILASSCTPASLADSTEPMGSSLRYVYGHTYNGGMIHWRNAAGYMPWMVLAIFLIIGGVMAFFLSEGMENTPVFNTILVIAFMIGALSARAAYTNLAKRGPIEAARIAQQQSITGMKLAQEQATYIYAELLNLPFTEMLPNSSTSVTKDSPFVTLCKSARDARSNCYPYEHTYDVYMGEDCYDDDGDGDTDRCVSDYDKIHDPDVLLLVRYAGRGRLPDKYASSETRLITQASRPDEPVMFFSDWMLPPDYQNRWWPGFAGTSYNPSAYTPPADWAAYKRQFDQAQVNWLSTWHKYSNPLLKTANADFVGDPAIVARLESAGMLLSPRELYGNAGGPTPTLFNFVYYLGSLKWQVDPQTDSLFQWNAQAVNTVYGNRYHISNSFAYVLQSDLDAQGVDIDTLLYTIKADMYNTNKWFRDFPELGGTRLFTIMQQNTILTVCTVVDTPNGRMIPNGSCRVMSGLPIGNEALKEAFAFGQLPELQNVAFTPQGFFGTPSLTSMPGGDMLISGTEGTPMGLWEKFGVKKPSMEENFGYLVDRVVLTQEQIDKVVADGIQMQLEIINGITFWPKVILAILVVLVLMGMVGIFQNL